MLKSCPYCGFKAVTMLQLPDTSLYFISCKECGARGPQSQTKSGAAKEWNNSLNVSKSELLKMISNGCCTDDLAVWLNEDLENKSQEPTPPWTDGIEED